MAKDKLQKGIEGTTFKPKKQFMGVFGDSKAVQKKYYDMTSAAKRDAHKKGRSEGKKFRARTFVDRETGTLRLDTVSNRKRFGKKVYKAPDVSYVEPRKYSKGGLKGNQKKLDKNNNNRIDAQDFKILRGQGKAPMKAKRGRIMKKDPTKPVNPFEKKSSKFIERRKKLGGVKSMLGKAGRIGLLGAALGVAGAGAAKLGQTIGRKMSEKKNKKMGGGMMKKPGYKYGKMIEDKFKKYARSKETQLHSKDALEGFERAEKRSASETMGEYKKDMKKYEQSLLKKLTRFSKGGGADTGTIGEAKSKLATGIDAFKRRQKKEKLQAPKRGPMNPAKAMGGGMMKRPMGYKSGSKLMDFIKSGSYTDKYGTKTNVDKAIKKINLSPKDKDLATMKPASNKKMMGGGMMMKPMGYKSGKSIKVKCKLGKNKPTKMY